MQLHKPHRLALVLHQQEEPFKLSRRQTWQHLAYSFRRAHLLRLRMQHLLQPGQRRRRA